MIPSGLIRIGHNLSRPECVLATQSGDIYCSHGARGVARLCADGRQFALSPPIMTNEIPVLANGIALRQDGSFLVANIGDGGGLFELDSDGMRLFHPCAILGARTPVNFVHIDALGKIWVTVSTTLVPRSLAYRRDVANGFVAVIENGQMRVVVENLAYTNEIRTDYSAGWLYIAETMGQRISRIRLDENGVSGPVIPFAQMPKGAFPDGLEFDQNGGLLVACIISSEVIHIAPDGTQSTLFGERMPAWVDEVENAFDRGVLNRPHLDTSPTQTLRNISSLAFAGADRKQMVLGNILDAHLLSVPAQISGREPVHWNVDVPQWGQAF